MSFTPENFLLTNKTAVRLYHEVAAREPVFEYQSLVPPERLARNQPFRDLVDLWLASDPGKERLMRANGVDERLITGDGEPLEKFIAWARTLPRALQHSLYTQSHLELKRLFAIDRLLSDKTARVIWDDANARLKTPELTPRGLLRKFRVIVQCVAADPADSLEPFISIRNERGALRIYPIFSTMTAAEIGDGFADWCERLERAAQTETKSWHGFLNTLRQRHEEFHALGGRLSAQRLVNVAEGSELMASEIYEKARQRQPTTPAERAQFATWLRLFLGQLDAAKGWTTLLQLDAAESERPAASLLAAHLAPLRGAVGLPKMIVQLANEADSTPIAAVLARFQEASMPARLQLALAAWEAGERGLEERLAAWSSFGLLGRSVGVASGGASLPSLCRHEFSAACSAM